MVGKAGRSGRKRIGGPKRAVQYRAEGDEVDALARLVADMQAEAHAAGLEATQASVVRGIVRAALIEKGYLRERRAPAIERAGKKKGAKR